MNDPGSHMRSPLERNIDKRLPSPVFRVKKRWDRPISRAAQTQKHFEKEEKKDMSIDKLLAVERVARHLN